MQPEREALRAQEDALVSALLANGPPPAGMDPAALERARHVLRAKAAWVAARRPARASWLRRVWAWMTR